MISPPRTGATGAKLARIAAVPTVSEGGTVKKTLDCPCGTRIQGEDEDDLVEKVQAHLAEKHPHLEYDRDAILFMAF